VLECERCGGKLWNIGDAYADEDHRRFDPIGTLWLCDECRHEQVFVAPDYVLCKPGLITVCLLCGRSYTWAPNVPISIFVAGNNAFTYDHLGCKEWHDDHRTRLLRVLSARPAVVSPDGKEVVVPEVEGAGPGAPTPP
jgi:hypothetical protein